MYRKFGLLLQINRSCMHMTDITIRIHPIEQRIIRFFLYVGCIMGCFLCLFMTLLVIKVAPLYQLLHMAEGITILALLGVMYVVTGIFFLFSRYYSKRLDIIGIDVRDNLMYCSNLVRSISGPVGSLSEVRITRRRHVNIIRFYWHYQSIGIGGMLCEKDQIIPYKTLRHSNQMGLERLVAELRIHAIPITER